MDLATLADPTMPLDVRNDRPGNRPRQKILRGGLSCLAGPKFRGKRGILRGNVDAYPRRLRKGVTLDMINSEPIAIKLIAPLQILVGLVTPAIYIFQLRSQAFHLAHRTCRLDTGTFKRS